MTDGRTGIKEAAREGTKEVAGTAKDEASHVVEEARTQASQVVEDARHELRRQAEAQAGTLADALHRVTDELRALAEGKPEQAGKTRQYVDQASAKLEDLASHVEQRGLQGMADDVAGFARRRPGAFLAGAAAAGFLAGRLFRASAQGSGGTQQQHQQQGTGQVSTSVTPVPPTAEAPGTIDLREEHTDAR